VGVVTHRVSMKSFNALPERGASPLPGLTWRHKMRIAGTCKLFVAFIPIKSYNQISRFNQKGKVGGQHEGKAHHFNSLNRNLDF
jgi:hypothetical protein